MSRLPATRIVPRPRVRPAGGSGALCSKRRGYQLVENRVGNRLYLEQYNRQTAANGGGGARTRQARCRPSPTAAQPRVAESASMNCQFYLRGHPNYSLLQHLPQIGSRVSHGCYGLAFCSRAHAR